jgi:hypothetical protein
MFTVNRTPPPQTTSTDRRLKRFTERITKMRQPPILELPIDDVHGGHAPPMIPTRSKRIYSGVEHISYPDVQAR